ncbi:MAG: hypothetical protein QXV75_08495 [Candidatus Bathyarchaeia archaeon]
MGKLKLPSLWIEYEVKSRDGKVLDKGKVESQTWVGNIVALISSLLAHWGITSQTNLYYLRTRADILDTTDTARDTMLPVYTNSPVGGAAPAGNTDAGILVGSSDAPVTINQYNLINLITHGSGQGQLQYGETTVDPLVKGSTWTLRIIRTFTNASGATVTVKEFGLFIRLGTRDSPYTYSAMLARDVPPSPVNVPNGSTLTLRYIISHSIS